MRRRWVRYAAIYLALAIGIGVVLGSFNVPYYTRLASNGQAVTGSVTRTECGHHGLFHYRFDVAGRTHTGYGRSGGTNPPCDELKRGDPVEIWFLTADPDINAPGNAHAWLSNEWTFVTVAALGMPLMVVLPEYFRRRHHRVITHG